MLNTITIMGRLTATPEIKYSTNNKAVTVVTVAVDRGKRDINGQKQTDFITVVMWEGLAEKVCRWVTKGQMITVQGRLQSREWQNRDGSNRRAWEVIAEKVYFVAEGKRSETSKIYDPENCSVPADFQELADGDDVPF